VGSASRIASDQERLLRRLALDAGVNNRLRAMHVIFSDRGYRYADGDC